MSNNKLIEIEEPQAGIWYILLDPINRLYEDVDLLATFTVRAPPKGAN